MRNLYGFTMIELLVVVTISALLLVFGSPQIIRMLETNNIATALNSLSAHLHYARSESVTRSTCVTVLPNTALSWQFGWTVFVDLDCNGARANNETLLKVVDDLNIPNFPIVPDVDYVTYNLLGRTITVPGGAPANANNFELRDYPNPGDIRILTVSPTGHVSIAN